MKITAIAVGTRGDVQPMAELGVEMRKRGHDYRVASLEKFRGLIEGKEVPFIHLDGDADLLMKLLVTDYVKSTDFLKGSKAFFYSVPGIMDQIEKAVIGSDVVIYGMLAGFTYHVCELHHIPCVRVFYSPFDRTNMYSLYTDKHNSFTVGLTYLSEEPGMNLLTIQLMNNWRVSHGLHKWHMTDDYRKMNGKPILTFYPVSPILMPEDPKWGNHIHVTGYWYHPKQNECFEPEGSLKAFLEEGKQPIFLGFGKAESEELRQLQNMAIEAVTELGIKAVVQADLANKKDSMKQNDNLYFIDNVPYEWLFERVKAVVHHGGCTTNGIGIRAGCPTLVIPLALDQYYYGRTIHEFGMGPKPLYIRKKICTKQELKAALLELVEIDYRKAADKLKSQIRKENGCETAAELIEKEFLHQK